MLGRLTPLIAALALGCGGGNGITGAVEPTPTRMMTPTEYNNSVRDLLSMPYEGAFPWGANGKEPEWEEDWEEEDLAGPEGAAAWPWPLPAEVGVHGFEGYAEGQVLSTYTAEQLQLAASAFSKELRRSEAFFTCGSLSGSDDAEACAEASVLRFANRAYRRPLTEEETERLLAFHRANVSGHGPMDGSVLTVQGLLMSPSFLYLPEFGAGDGDQIALTDWEVATRLSMFLWDGIPDPALFEAASKGELQTAKGIEKQAKRMLKDPRARDALVHYHSQWLELDKVYTNRADLNTYFPKYVGELPTEQGELANEEVEEQWSSVLIGWRVSQEVEAKLFLENVLFSPKKGTLRDLLTDNTGYATLVGMDEEEAEGGNATSQLYNAGTLSGAPAINLTLEDGNLGYNLQTFETTYPADQRAGVLTLGATLASRSHPVHPAPVLRGVFLLERLACDELGQPPPSAAGTAPPDTLDAEASNRDRVAAITSDPGCAACHNKINPLGFAFENYDSLGGWRTEDNGNPIDASGTLLLNGEDPKSFGNAVELAGLLADSPSVQACYAKTMLHYAIGRHEQPSEADQVTQILTNFQSDGVIETLILDIVTSDLFRFRRSTGGAQ